MHKDPVKRPQHYTLGKVECIEAIQASMTRHAFAGYLKGNVMKYLWRYETKGQHLQDLLKAEWYLKSLITLIPVAQLEERGTSKPRSAGSSPARGKV